MKFFLLYVFLYANGEKRYLEESRIFRTANIEAAKLQCRQQSNVQKKYIREIVRKLGKKDILSIEVYCRDEKVRYKAEKKS